MADVIVAVVPYKAPSTQNNVGVNLDITSSKFGGITPKAVILFQTLDTALDTESLTAAQCIGFAVNGGNQYADQWSNTNPASGTTNAVINRRSISKVMTVGSSAAQPPLSSGSYATVGSWIADGVRVNFQGVLGQDTYGFAVIIGGSDVEAYTGIETVNGVNPVIDVTAPGFMPDIVFVSCPWNTAADYVNITNARSSFGAVTQDGVQHCSSYNDWGGTGSHKTNCGIFNDRVMVAPVANSTTVAMSGVAGSFDTDGFTMTVTGTGTTEVFHYLALKLGAAAKVFQFAARTTTGDLVETAPGFLPQAAIVVSTGRTTGNAFVNDADEASPQCWSAFDDTNQAANYVRLPYNLTQPDPYKLTSQTDAVGVGSTTTARVVRATRTSFDAAGWTLNYNTVSGNATLGWAVAFPSPPPPPPPPPTPLDIYSDVVQFLTAGGGTTDATSANFAGKTPKAVITFPTSLTTADDGVEQPTMEQAIGFAAAGSGQYALAAASADSAGGANTAAFGRIYDDRVTFTLRQQNIGYLNSFIPDGVRFTWDAVSSGGRACYAMLLGGDDLEAFAGDTVLAGATTTISGLSFTPDAVMMITRGDTSINTPAGNYGFSVGWALKGNGKNYCHGGYEENNFFASGRPVAQFLYDDAIAAKHAVNNGALVWKLTIDNWTADGFDIVAAGTTGSEVVAFLALKFGTHGVDIAEFVSPTSISTLPVTGVNFTPSVIMSANSNLTAFGYEWDTDPSCVMGFGIDGATTTFESSVRLNRNVNQTDSATVIDHHLGRHGTKTDTTAGGVFDLQSYDVDGFTLDYTAVSGNAEQHWALVIQAPAGAPPDDSNSQDSNSNSDDPPPDDSNSQDSNSNSDDPAVGGLRAGFIFVGM